MNRIWSILISIMLYMATIIFPGKIFGQQDTKSGDQGKQESAPAKSEEKSQDSTNAKTGTDLERFHARENAIQYDDIIRDHIYKLQVVVANYGEASDKSTLDSISKEHVNGKKELFKRKYISAYSIFKKVNNDIQKLFIGLADRYQSKTNEILGLCAETLVDREIGIGNKADMNVEAAGKTSKKVTNNRIKLVIAYDHLNMGDRFKYEDRLSDAVTHYRLAKLHGINILVDMAETENDKASIKNQYKLDLMDGDNLVSK